MMVTVRQAVGWARSNRKYTLAITVMLLVLLALAAPGTRNYRPYSVEVSCHAHSPCQKVTSLDIIGIVGQ